MCTSPKFICGSPSPQCDSIRHFDLWELIRSEFSWLGLVPLCKTPHSCLSPCHGRTHWNCLQWGSRLSPDTESAGISILDHVSSRPVRNRCLLLMFPTWEGPACTSLGVLQGQKKVCCGLLGARIWRLCDLGVEFKVLTRLGLAWGPSKRAWEACRPRSLSNSAWQCREPLWHWKSFPGDLDGKESACNAGGQGLIPGSGRPPGEGNGYPL